MELSWVFKCTGLSLSYPAGIFYLDAVAFRVRCSPVPSLCLHPAAFGCCVTWRHLNSLYSLFFVEGGNQVQLLVSEVFGDNSESRGRVQQCPARSLTEVLSP